MSELQFHALVELDVVMRGRTKAVHPPNVRVPHDEKLRLLEMHNFRGPRLLRDGLERIVNHGIINLRKFPSKPVATVPAADRRERLGSNATYNFRSRDSNNFVFHSRFRPSQRVGGRKGHRPL